MKHCELQHWQQINQLTKMKQNYINPQSSFLPDIAKVKRQLQFNNYQFNEQQLQRRQEKLKRQRQLQIQQSTLANQRTLIQVENAKLRQFLNKHRVQDTLQKEYDRQIYTRERIKTQEKSHDRFFSQKQKQVLENYERNRIYDMAKIYNISNTKKDKKNYYTNRSLLTEGCEDSLDNLRNQSYQQARQQHGRNTPVKPHQHQDDFAQTETLKIKNKSLCSVQQPIFQNSRGKKYSAVNLQYCDYLKKQIQRKQRQKEQHKKRQLEKDRIWMQRQNRSYHQNMEQMNYRNHKKKYDYATGLDKQLSWNKQFQHRL